MDKQYLAMLIMLLPFINVDIVNASLFHSPEPPPSPHPPPPIVNHSNEENILIGVLVSLVACCCLVSFLEYCRRVTRSSQNLSERSSLLFNASSAKKSVFFKPDVTTISPAIPTDKQGLEQVVMDSGLSQP